MKKKEIKLSILMLAESELKDLKEGGFVTIDYSRLGIDELGQLVITKSDNVEQIHKKIEELTKGTENIKDITSISRP